MAEKKRTFKENMALLARGYRLLYQLLPRHFIWSTVQQVFRQFSPYFSLYMSTLLLNELAGNRNVDRMILYAAVTLFGLLALNLISRLIDRIVTVVGSSTWRVEELYYFDRQNRMEYRHLENPDISLLRQNIFAAKNSSGQGLSTLIWLKDKIIAQLTKLILSVSLTISMFRMSASGEFHGFLGFLDSGWAAAIIIVLIFINAFVSSWTSKKTNQRITKAYENLSYSNILLSVYDDCRGTDVTIFNMRTLILEHMRPLMIHPTYVTIETKAKIRYQVLIHNICDAFIVLALFIYVAGKAFMGCFGIGNFILYRGTAAKFVGAIEGIVGAYELLIYNNKYLAQIFEYLDLPDDRYLGTLSVVKRDDNKFNIEFRDVSFRYPNTEQYALRHINLKFNLGEKLAVVGRNGSGKTTFIKLLCRLYDPTEGKILLNGIDITRYNYDEYIRLFSAIFQDYTTFQFTIADNVSCSLDYNEDRVMQSLDKAGLTEKIKSLEKGIKTAIGRNYEDDGVDFSGGELQKLAIARALYKDAPFIVLDEPTAALDPIAEADVYENFDKMVEGKTAIYISHRLSSCRFCDNIMVFDGGEIVQRGSHDELVSDPNGKYYELWNAQAQYYTET